MDIIYKKIKWQLISRKGVNFENLWLSIAAYGFIDYRFQKRKIFGPTYPSAYRQIHGHRDMPAADIARFLSKAKKAELRKPGSILKTYHDYQSILDQTRKYADKISKINFSVFGNRQLAKFFKDYAKIVGKTIWYGYNYYFYDYLGQDLYDILKNKEKDITQQARLFEILTQAKKLSVIQQEQKELLLLVKKIKDKKLSIQKVADLIDRHLAKFSFMGFYYYRGKQWVFPDIKKRLMVKIKQNFESELKKIISFEKQNNDWQKLARRLNFSKQEIILVETLKQMAYCTNLYDENSNYLSAKSQNLFYEISKRLKIKYQELVEMDVLEVINGLNNGLTDKFIQQLKERMKDSVLLLADNKVRILSGQDLIKYRKLFIKEERVNQNVKELKGQAASAGYAKGRVVLVYSVNDLSKVKRGNIMVAKATVPSFVPAMEKARGIITESGGLLSHSAIVSRELKIPCIVGIKDLMKILKDGDKVEVDATKGIIKKI